MRFGDAMRFEGRLGVVSGRYHSVDGLNERNQPSTVLELFGRSEDGESVCVLVHGLRPTFEVSPLTVWNEGMEVPSHVTERLESIKQMDDVLEVSGPTMKLTDLGMRPLWRVTVRQPFVVPSLRKALAKQSWQIFSGDIPFLNRLFLDEGLGMHLSVNGTVAKTGCRPDVSTTATAPTHSAGARRCRVCTRCR